MKKLCSKGNPHSPVVDAVLLAACTATFFLGGCSDHSQQVEEQVTQLQKQVDQLQGQLQTANRDLSNARDEASRAKAGGSAENKPASDAGGSAALPSKEALEESYETSARALRKQVESKLTNFRVDSCTLHSVQMPESLYPFTSNISFSLRANDGKAYQMDLPVKADFSGKWIFPDTGEIVTRIEAAKNTPPATPAPAGNNLPAGQAETPPPKMAVDGTIVIQWPGSPNLPSRPSRAADTSPTPPETPLQPSRPQVAPPSPSPQNSNPAPVMPVNRDVLIKF